VHDDFDSDPRTGPLISPDELAASLRTVTVLDVRYLMGGPPGRE
jgi:thiosulfate/3-mercaptopyruvate sulfurtransferase